MVHRIGFSVAGAKVSDRAMPFACKIAKTLFPFTSFFKALSLNRAHRYDIVWAMMANQAGFGALFFKRMHSSVGYFLDLQDGRALADMTKRQPVLRIMWNMYRNIYLRGGPDQNDLELHRSRSARHRIRRSDRSHSQRGRRREFSADVFLRTLAELKAHFDKQPGDIFLFTASRLVLSRGVEDAIGALAFLPERVKLLVAGDGEDREKLEHIARGLDVI